MDNDPQNAQIEAPLHSLDSPGPPSPVKPIKDMSDEELENWHASLRDLQAHQTLVAAMRAGGVESRKPKVDISEYS